jgi:AraC-like DNA-binding protein
MLFEPTTLAATAKIIAETLETHYSVDPAPIFAKAGLDISRLSKPGARYPSRHMQALWRAAVEASRDPCFGLYAGRSIRPSFHALGFSWIACQSLLGSLQRLCRYHDVISTIPIILNISEADDCYEMTIEYPDPKFTPEIAAIDAFVAAIIQLCRTATNSDFAPVSIEFKRTDRCPIETYIKILGCPVTMGAEHITLRFERKLLEKPLPGANIELAQLNDSVVEKYLASRDANTVPGEVRKFLIAELPSGNPSQQQIAARMHRSLSTLQRQLYLEGTSYRKIRDDTRRQLAIEYVREAKLSLSQIAYLLGYSDQSNFSRAFRRWTGTPPKEFH